MRTIQRLEEEILEIEMDEAFRLGFGFGLGIDLLGFLGV